MQRIINSHYSERTGVSPADIMFGKSLDLDRGVFLEIPEDEMYAKGSLSTHMTELLKTQSDMIECHKQIIQKVDINHTLKTASAKYTVFDTGSNVLFEPATGKPKDRLHSRKLGPFLFLDHEDNTYNLQNLVSKKKFKVNITRIHPFHFEKQRVNPQEVAAHYSDEFIVASILSHTGDFKKKIPCHFRSTG